MNVTFSNAGKQILHDLLSQCSEPQQELFKLMYARNGGKRSVEDAKLMPIRDVVDQMDEDRIDWAITQCERTVNKNQAKSITF